MFEENDLQDQDEVMYEADLAEAVPVSCPYCGEMGEIGVDLGGGGLQEYVEDCAVCCRPWAVRLFIDRQGQPQVHVTTLDDE